MKSANEQVAEWLKTASREQLKSLVEHLYANSMEAAVLIYQWQHPTA